MAALNRRLIAPALVLLLSASACSGNDNDIATLPEISTTPTTPSTTTSSTTTTKPTTTTLSDLEQAEAQVRDVVIEWYEFPLDYSLGQEGIGLEQTTGLLRQRILESASQLEADGQVLRSAAPARIEIMAVGIDLDAGTAEVEACTGSGDELVDAETLEVITSSDPTETSVSTFQLQLTDGQWKISEWLPSGPSQADLIDCEIEE